MNALAFLLAVTAVVLLLLAAYPSTRRRAVPMALGQAVAVSAWVVQSVWVSSHIVTVR